MRRPIYYCYYGIHMKKSNFPIAAVIILVAIVSAATIVYLGGKRNRDNLPHGVAMQGNRQLRIEELPSSFLGTSTNLSNGWSRYTNEFLHFSIDVPVEIELQSSATLWDEGGPDEHVAYAITANDSTQRERILDIGAIQTNRNLKDELSYQTGNLENYIQTDVVVSGTPAIMSKFDPSKDPVHQIPEPDQVRTTNFIWKGYFYGVTTRGIPMADLDRIWKSFTLLD